MADQPDDTAAGDLPPYDHEAAMRLLDAVRDPNWTEPQLRDMPCPRCRRGECDEPSGRYVVTATYEAVVIAHNHDEALEIADDAKYDHRCESMRMKPDSADVRWPE